MPWTGWPAGLPTPGGFHANGLAILGYCNNAKEKEEPSSSPWSAIKTVDELAFAPSDVATLPAKPDQRVIAEFNLVFPGGVPLGVFAIDGGNYSTFVNPEEPPLFSIANGLNTSQLPVTANAVSISLGKHVEVVLVNTMNDQHPMHMHTHTPWVVASGQASRDAIFSGDISSLSKLSGPIKRDTYTVPPCNVDASTGECVDVGFIVLRFVTDNPGAWMIHCHVEWHMDIGMSMLFIEGEKELQSRCVTSFSSSMRNTCNGKYAA